MRRALALYGPCLGLAVCLAAGAVAGDSASQDPALLKWTDRVIPLPKEISVLDAVTMPVGAIRVAPCACKAAPAQTGLWLLRAFAPGGSSRQELTISLALLEDCRESIPAGIRERLPKLPNSEQAYAIVSAPDKRRLCITANAPTGLLYGARTLLQLMMPPRKLDRLVKNEPERRPEYFAPFVEVEVPFPLIVDWPDMPSRGIWGCGSVNELPWLSKWKVNYAGRHLRLGVDPKTGDPVSQFDQKVVTNGYALGVHIFPYIAHLDMNSDRGLNMHLIPREDRLKRWLPAMNVKEGKVVRGFCYTDPVCIELLTAWMMQQAGLIHGVHNDMQIWLTEGDGHLHLRDKASGKSFTQLETAALLQAFGRVKKRYPGMKLNLWLSQGSLPETEAIIEQIKPNPDVGLIYYSGSGPSGRNTYVTDRVPMIFPALTEFAAAGRYVGVVPQLTASYRTFAPMSSAEFVRMRCDEFVSKKLGAIVAYVVNHVRQHELNVVAMAEYSWNAKGRSPRDFARAYATVTGICDPKLFAEWEANAGAAGFALAESCLLFPKLWHDPALGFYGSQSFQDHFKGKVIGDPAGLKKAHACARGALELAGKSGSWLMRNESEFTLACFECLDALRIISVLTDSPPVDQDGKRTTAEQLDRLDRAAHAVRVSRFEWYDWTRQRPHYRFYYTATVLLRTCDAVRTVLQPLGIPDPRPDTRFTEIGEWSNANFSRPRFGDVELDITDRVPEQGGSYHVVLTHIDGSGIENMTARLIAVGPDSKRRTASVSPEWWGVGSQYGKEARLFVPAKKAGERYILALRLRSYDPVLKGQDEPHTEGVIGMRRVYGRGEFPSAGGRRSDLGQAAARGKAETSVNPLVWSKGATIRVGVTDGWGSGTIISALRKQAGIDASPLRRLTAAALRQCHVIIVPQALTPNRLKRDAPKITQFVANGGGVLFTHDAVGYRAHAAMFKSVGGGRLHPKLAKLKVSREHPVTAGLKVNHGFLPGFLYDHVIIKPGADGEVLVTDEQGDPVVVAGASGKGRVVLDGKLTGRAGDRTDSSGADGEPTGTELTILINAVHWLAGASPK